MTASESQRAYVGLGSNLNDPPRRLDAGIEALAALPGSTGLRCSPRYQTRPVGDTAQPEFLNAVATFETNLPPLALLDALQAIESAQGRVRDPHRRFGPRTLDLDLLMLGDLTYRDERLTLPHPRMHERAFVLQPLAELAPTLEIPGHGRVDALLERVGCGGLHRSDAL